MARIYLHGQPSQRSLLQTTILILLFFTLMEIGSKSIGHEVKVTDESGQVFDTSLILWDYQPVRKLMWIFANLLFLRTR